MNQEHMDVEILKYQNALIAQKVDQTKLKKEIDMLYERSEFYEKLYNQTKADFYELEIKLTKLHERSRLYETENLMEIILKRIKRKFSGGNYESDR